MAAKSGKRRKSREMALQKQPAIAALEQERDLADNRRLGTARHQHGEIVPFDMRDQRLFAGLGEGRRQIDQFGTSLCLNFDL